MRDFLAIAWFVSLFLLRHQLRRILFSERRDADEEETTQEKEKADH